MSIKLYVPQLSAITLLVCGLTSSIFSNALITTPKYTQENPQWCWIATTKMALDYYKLLPSKTQSEICTYSMGSIQDVPGWLSNGPFAQKAIDAMLKGLKNLDSKWDGGVLSMADFAAAILKGRPIFIGSANDINTIGHVVLSVGFDTKDGSNVVTTTNPITAVYYNDPFNGKTVQKDFAVLRQATNKNGITWVWTQTLRLATDGPVPPVAINDHVDITAFTYNYFYPFTSKSASTVFTSNVVPADHCYSFNWALSFNHASGTYTAQSGVVTGTDQSTWTISPFNLPTGYSWVYHPTGAVPGTLSVSCTDNKGFPHSDQRAVLFYPSNYYPVDVVYENMTTSTTQADVKAHNWIGISKDNLNSGTRVNFRAGTSITIFDETTISNGSAVILSIEPSLQ